jgi:hypothetical protein
VNLQEVDVHPMTGSWGANLSSDFEVDFLPDGTLSANQAYLGYTTGSADSFFTALVGIMPNYLGFGPFDRPIAISTPLVLSSSASNPVLDTLFNWADPRAAGVAASYWVGDTFVSANIRNRLAVANGAVDGIGSPSTNRMGDILLQATQFIDKRGSGSAVNLAYYHGQTRLPDGSGGSFANNFDHVVGSANWYATDQVNLYAGGGWGADKPEAGFASINSAGGFAGAEYFWSGAMAVGGRYDSFRSDINTADSGVKEGTIYYHYRPMNQLTLSTELQYQQNGLGATSNAGVNQSVLTVQALLAF